MITVGKAKSVSRRHLFKNVGSLGIVRGVNNTGVPMAEPPKIWQGELTDATETELFLNGVTDERYLLEDDGVYSYEYFGLIIDNSTSESVYLRLTGAVKIVSGTLSLLAEFKQYYKREFAGAIRFDVDNTNSALIVYATGTAGRTCTAIVSKNPSITL